MEQITYKEISTYSNGKLELAKVAIPVINNSTDNSGHQVSVLNAGVLNTSYLSNHVNSTILANQYKNLTYSCVNLRCDNASKAKPILKVRNNQTDTTELNDHVFLDVLENELYNWLNENISYSELLFHTTWFLDLFGNCFWEIERNSLDKIKSIRVLVSEKELWDIKTNNYGIDHYIYGIGTKFERKIEARNIIHFKFQAKRATDLFGMGIVEAGIDTFYLENSINIYQRKHFDNDAMKKFVLTTTKNFNDISLQGYLEKFNQEHAGQFNAGSVPLFPSGIEPKVLSNTPHEADFVETWKLVQTKTLALWRCNESLIGITDNTNRATDTHAYRNFLNFLIDSIIKKIDSKMSLILRKIYDPKLCIEHKLVMPIDEQFEFDKLDKEATHGAITINEYRKDNGRDPITGGDVLINSADKSVKNEQ